MSQERSPALFACRPASRRLHRRSLAAAAPFPVPPAAMTPPRTLLPLAEQVVRDAGMLELLAAEMRIAELERALAEAQAAAATDSLTGAPNRRAFADGFAREMARCRRAGAPLALALIDLDDFKRINDTRGHQAGDRALVHCVETLRAALRPGDLLARFGGEEFVLLLPEADLSAARATLLRLQTRLAATPVEFADEDFALSFSAGIAEVQPDESLEILLARADAAVYRAKAAGKNRVECA